MSRGKAAQVIDRLVGGQTIVLHQPGAPHPEAGVFKGRASVTQRIAHQVMAGCYRHLPPFTCFTPFHLACKWTDVPVVLAQFCKSIGCTKEGLYEESSASMISIAGGEGVGKTFLLQSVSSLLPLWIQQLELSEGFRHSSEDREAALKVCPVPCLGLAAWAIIAACHQHADMQVIEAGRALFAYVDFWACRLKESEVKQRCPVDLPLGLRVLASFLKFSLEDFSR